MLLTWYMLTSTNSDATGFFPYFLVFGREAKLPVNVCFGIHLNGDGDYKYSSYVEKLKDNLQKAYKMATELSNKTHLRNKKANDKRL